MLKTRLLTALVLIPLLLAALFWLPSSALAALFGVIIAIGAWEWGALCGFHGGRQMSYVAALMLTGILAVAPIVLLPPGEIPVMLLLVNFGVVLVFWLAALVAMVRGRENSFLYHSIAGRALSGFFVLVPAWQAAVVLHAHDLQQPALLLFLFLLVWGRTPLPTLPVTASAGTSSPRRSVPARPSKGCSAAWWLFCCWPCWPTGSSGNLPA